MIVQCEACQTRFRLADEKIKAGGTKVRCSKCKEVFTVMPPEPEPVEESIDFDSFNMEKIADDAPDEETSAAASVQQTPEPEEQPDVVPVSSPEATEPEENNELDFSAFEATLDGDAGQDGELADDFSFAGTDKPTADDFSMDEESAAEEQTDFDAAFAEAADPDGAFVFEFNEEPAWDAEETAKADSDFSTEESTVPSDFDFSDDKDAAQEQDGPDAFSFDDDDSDDEPTASEWDADAPRDDNSFEFSEPDFGDNEVGSSTQGLPTGGDFSKATLERQRETEPFTPSRQNTPPPLNYADEGPLLAPPAPKKSSLSRILMLLVLLLVILGAAAGYLFMQEGSLSLNMVARYLPFLQEYIGEAPVGSPADFVRIDNPSSSYVNGRAGQMLVIQGAVVNNYPATRSAITVKGVLLDAAGQTLLQQTVFCGNKLDDAALASMSFASIEEAMNNPFGEAFSNMNVAPGSSVSFTIVFRNPPKNIANINVEVISSEPGAG
jgi:predicted Zn finger-like uncharacterized protein